jgi:hypothetical protein
MKHLVIGYFILTIIFLILAIFTSGVFAVILYVIAFLVGIVTAYEYSLFTINRDNRKYMMFFVLTLNKLDTTKELTDEYLREVYKPLNLSDKKIKEYFERFKRLNK